MSAQLGAQPVSVQLSHDREGDGRFHDGADALGAWGRRIPLAAGLLQRGSGRTAGDQFHSGARMWNCLHDSLRDAAAQNVLDGIRIHQFPQDFDKSVRPAQKGQQTPFQAHQVAGAPPLLRSDSFQKESSMRLRQQAAGQFAFPLEAQEAAFVRLNFLMGQKGKAVRMKGISGKGCG